MSTILCMPDYYIGVLVVVGFALGYIMPKLGEYMKKHYGWFNQ